LRYFLELAYRGTAYHGWQIQANAHSLQAEIQHKMGILLKQPVEIVASGRTDTGVHARQQVVHFDSPQILQPAFLHKLNALLPKDIAAYQLYEVPADWHARFTATSRRYAYYITSRKDPFEQGLSFYLPLALQVSLMQQAAALLPQQVNYQSFSKVKTEVKHFDCQVFDANWQVVPDGLVFHIEANRFLRGMVRALVGTMIEVGKQKLSLEKFAAIFQQQDRRAAGWAAPPDGLFLEAITYPPLPVSY